MKLFRLTDLLASVSIRLEMKNENDRPLCDKRNEALPLPTMQNPKFSLFKSSVNRQYYYRLRSSNGEIILNGEGYYSKQSCHDAIASVKINAPVDSRYERKDGYNNYTFNLKASNGEIIGRSENYTTSSARENGIAAVKRDAPYAPTEDLS